MQFTNLSGSSLCMVVIFRSNNQFNYNLFFFTHLFVYTEHVNSLELNGMHFNAKTNADEKFENRYQYTRI